MHVSECCPDVEGKGVLWLRALASDICVTLGRSLKFPGPPSICFRSLLQVLNKPRGKGLTQSLTCSNNYCHFVEGLERKDSTSQICCGSRLHLLFCSGYKQRGWTPSSRPVLISSGQALSLKASGRPHTQYADNPACGLALQNDCYSSSPPPALLIGATFKYPLRTPEIPNSTELHYIIFFSYTYTPVIKFNIQEINHTNNEVEQL